MNHHYPNPGNGREDRAKHSVNQVAEDRAARALPKTNINIIWAQSVIFAAPRLDLVGHLTPVAEVKQDPKRSSPDRKRLDR